MNVINVDAANRVTAVHVNGPVGIEDLNNEFKRGILEFMLCCVCAKYIHPPVTEICENGHNGCVHCVRNLEKCPICNLPAEKFWNTGVEEACRNLKLKIPCNNKHLGCDAETDIDEVKKHYEMCEHHSISCPLSPPRGPCKWKGTVLGVREHVEESHRECEVHVTDEERITMSYPCVDRKVIVIRGNDVFLVVTDFSPLFTHLRYACILVEYCGSHENFPKFKYEFKLGTQAANGLRSISYSVTTPEQKRDGELHVHIQKGSMDKIKRNRPLEDITYTIIIVKCT